MKRLNFGTMNLAVLGLMATLLLAPARVQAASRPQVNKWIVTISISFGTLMGAIDSSIVNVALPHIRGAVGATLLEITWISTGYAVALVLVMPLTAFLSRQFGQKRIYMACLLLFLVGSFLCGTATTLPSTLPSTRRAESLRLHSICPVCGSTAMTRCPR